MSGMEDASQSSGIRNQGHTSSWRRKVSHEYVDPDTIRKMRNTGTTMRNMANIEDMVNSRHKEERRNMGSEEDMRNLEETRSIDQDIRVMEEARVRLDTGDSRGTEYFFMQGSGQCSPQAARPRAQSIMDKIE